MGELRRLDVAGYVERFGCRHFIETGTGMGTGVAEALKHPFETVHSIELEYVLYRQGVDFFDKHPDRRLRLHHGQSDRTLPLILSVIPSDEPVLYFLDAHFPGADFNLRSYSDEWRDNVRLPLETELRIILAKRPESRDVIICDDMRLYLDSDFELGPPPDDFRKIMPKQRNVDFIYDLFRDTHNIEVVLKDHGYAILTPA